MLFLPKVLRGLLVGLLSITAPVSYYAQADLPMMTEVAGVILSSEGQVVAQEIERVFFDAPEMLYIANCESRGLIHRKGGALIKNQSGTSAQGVFQVLMRVHRPEMFRMGLRPEELEDYLIYVRHLYDTYGTGPWVDSKKCWQKQIRALKRA